MGMKRRRSRRGGLLAIGAVVSSAGLLAAMSGPAGASSAPASRSPHLGSVSFPGVSGSPDGWITYTRPLASRLSLKDVRVTTVAGRHDAAGGCVVGSSASESTAAAPGSPASFQEEVAFNPRSCRERVLSGTLTAAGLSRLNALRSGRSGAPVTASGRAQSARPPASRTADTTSYQSAYTKTAWIDPLDITITSLANNLTWPLYGAGGTLTETAYPYDFPYDGWSSSGVSFSPFYYTSSYGGGWYISASDQFTNTDFATFVYVVFGFAGWAACGFPTTATAVFNHDVTTYGYSSDARNRSWSDTANGACVDLVHHGEWDGFGTTS